MATGSIVVTRLTLVAAGIIGAAGVMAAAGASHGEASRNLSAVATICLAHGPALLALGLAGRGRILRFAAVSLGLGTLVFAGDLGVREWLGHGLFPGAAPLGGGGMILGWAAIVAAGAFARTVRI
ncbi:hypothetical protein WH87_16110 [Devosia epidermidihirudinis]|uniref:Uncharacterized protein n=1 Tax=Devosia epidermidihirudinis TaxID=1293439 RepID=A0A0F5Q3T1_9HYPH|nr:DUF423 domain-containing protein [Devosia epidermidihirudinis]KKC35573.1 hypothetical protein WH87_16110 [Devosia epidermidihirudinis]